MCDYRESRESWEWDNLAPYASHSSDPSLSWRRSEEDPEIAEPNPARSRPLDIHFPNLHPFQTNFPDFAGSISRFKTAFQLDKERIASSNAFRRLEYKTQVFVSHEGDHYRTRLTHTIEVNETARFVAQALQLNEDLVDAIALGHDVGHTPFGHSGEEALNKLFKKYWPDKEPFERIHGELYGPAFYHNVQSVRVVDFLEKGYEWDRRPVRKHADHGKVQYPLIARGRGLDLTWAVREGILKHSSRGLRAKDEIRMYSSDYLMQELRSFQPATLEGQVIEFADEIASMMHDLEDGLRSRLFSLDDLRKELSKKLKETGEAGLAELLGLTANFAHKELDSPRTRSRISKMEYLLEQIEIGEGKDCTVGTVLAVLRSLLISNLIEASYARLVYVMAGSKSMNEIINVPSPTNHKKDMSDELIWLHFQIDAPLGPIENSYCTEAWDIEDIIRRKVTVQTFRRGEKGISPSSDLMLENNLQVFWTSRTTNRLESRSITVKRENGLVSVYPLGNVCITFGGAKMIGYHENLLPLRNWLRKEFIPNHLHRASVVLRTTNKGQRWLEDLFELYYSTPNIIHRSALERFSMWAKANDTVPDLQKDPRFILRIVEHLQGMTDRYLTEEYLRLFLDGTKMRETPEVNVVDGDVRPF